MNIKSNEKKGYLSKIPDWFKDGTESILWNIFGNLIPIWFALGISIYEYGIDKWKIYEAIHQPYTFLILSATYLTSTFYIFNRKGNFYKHNYFSFIFVFLLMIIGYTIKDRKSLEDVSANFNKEIFVVLIFLLSFFFYVIFEYCFHKTIENTSSIKESNKQFDGLKDSFKNQRDNE